MYVVRSYSEASSELLEFELIVFESTMEAQALVVDFWLLPRRRIQATS